MPMRSSGDGGHFTMDMCVDKALCADSGLCQAEVSIQLTTESVSAWGTWLGKEEDEVTQPPLLLWEMDTKGRRLSPARSGFFPSRHPYLHGCSFISPPLTLLGLFIYK